VLRSPSGALAARISPFDPVATYTTELFRRAASTGFVPALHALRPLDGGAVCTVMEYLLPTPPDEAAAFFEALAGGGPRFAELARIIAAVLEEAHERLPWCDRLDTNPSNVMRRRHGGLVLTDPFFADGPTMYGSILTDPLQVARLIPPEQRRHMLELPLAESGPWDPVQREKMRVALASADAGLAGAP
jgi:hypothetical protein